MKLYFFRTWKNHATVFSMIIARAMACDVCKRNIAKCAKQLSKDYKGIPFSNEFMFESDYNHASKVLLKKATFELKSGKCERYDLAMRELSDFVVEAVSAYKKAMKEHKEKSHFEIVTKKMWVYENCRGAETYHVNHDMVIYKRYANFQL